MRFLSRNFALDYKAFAFPFNDRGVSQDFFDRMSEDEEIDLLFGTSSMMQDDALACDQRTIMETLPVPAPGMIAVRYMRKLMRQSIGRNRMVRSCYTHRAGV